MDDTVSSNRGLDPLLGSFAFAIGTLLALYGGTAFAAHVYRHAVAFDRLAFADAFVPALVFVVGVSVAFGAFVGVLLHVLQT
ncbi:hypothetical protein [Halorussus sp. MSC15.2]|uniref:hypothetical protein n=1 Tax=Halorussus sp. MSC15.2 TaxID=2283638 RepID=UPI0013D5973E|nr:hypothetical protein [Halorussus sp. MSC15.2]NEU55506.1 hypothetical protein [Halorussus sp. MSC15.2]